ncbi:MAG: hypothetical protein C0483_20125 [Pirellula sp.]|nr:hypothetical protein [Pirellula sp.]
MSCPYTTLQELRAKLCELEHVTQLTVVLVLDNRFAGHLSSLIERRRPAARLILAIESGRLPGWESIGDLLVTGSALGWREIVVERDIAGAVRAADRTLRPGEHFVVFHPSWLINDEIPLRDEAQSAATANRG